MNEDEFTARCQLETEDLSEGEEVEDEEISDLAGPEKEEGIGNLETGSEEGSLRWWRERVAALQKEADDVDHGEGGEISDDEDAMLAEAFHVKNNSRLSCQLQISSALEGLKIIIAPEV